VRIPDPAIDEREQQAMTPDVFFHKVMQDMQQRMDSMATAIGTLKVARPLSVLLVGRRLISHL
jgi:hypothetical protein